MRYFPLFLDLDNRKAVVVGGGEEALRKIRLLLKTKAKITVIAPTLHDELLAHVKEDRLAWVSRSFVPSLLDKAVLVYSANNDLHREVSQAARDRGIPVNAIDDAALSTFITPSIVDRDPVVVAIGTEGTSPVLGMGLRSKIEALLPQALGSLAIAASHLRQSVAERVPHGNRRRSFWQRYFFGSIRDSFMAGDAGSYTRELEAALIDVTSPSLGRVSLVGAGPGDPELLTLKAKRKLQEAAVIVH